MNKNGTVSTIAAPNVEHPAVLASQSRGGGPIKAYWRRESAKGDHPMHPVRQNMANGSVEDRALYAMMTKPAQMGQQIAVYERNCRMTYTMLNMEPSIVPHHTNSDWWITFVNPAGKVKSMYANAAPD